MSTGSWAVAVSGGADSVALFTLLRTTRQDVSIHVVHLDHQTRAGASTEDADFVADLSAQFSIPCTIARLDQIEPSLAKAPANTSSRYRAARQEHFRQVVAQHNLQGVLLAHHADDQAETVLLRLIRGSSASGLVGMAPETHLGDLRILRPLLSVDSDRLRQYLRQQNQPWREDASNASPKYLRNLLRPLIRRDPKLRDALIHLAQACRHYKDWLAQTAPNLPDDFEVGMLQDLPSPLARESARKWLSNAGSPLGKLSEDVLDRVVQMACDAAYAARQEFPGKLRVSRRGGRMVAESTGRNSRDIP
jgi:tRNA(Ile)-lysidine synthase